MSDALEEAKQLRKILYEHPGLTINVLGKMIARHPRWIYDRLQLLERREMKGLVFPLTDDLSHEQLISLLVYLAPRLRSFMATVKAWRKKQGLPNDCTDMLVDTDTDYCDEARYIKENDLCKISRDGYPRRDVDFNTWDYAINNVWGKYES